MVGIVNCLLGCLSLYSEGCSCQLGVEASLQAGILSTVRADDCLLIVYIAMDVAWPFCSVQFDYW